jgi:hypothetical protein
MSLDYLPAPSWIIQNVREVLKCFIILQITNYFLCRFRHVKIYLKCMLHFPLEFLVYLLSAGVFKCNVVCIF